jgi:hypothetical protein
MFKSEQYRAKAAEYAELAERSNTSDEVRKFQKLQRSFSELANNEQWLADNHEKTVVAPQDPQIEAPALAAEEEHALRCLGAALIMQWNTLPTQLQRKLFDNAGSMGEVLDTVALRGQIARFLHKHKDDDLKE